MNYNCYQNEWLTSINKMNTFLSYFGQLIIWNGLNTFDYNMSKFKERDKTEWVLETVRANLPYLN